VFMKTVLIPKLQNNHGAYSQVTSTQLNNIYAQMFFMKKG